MTRKDPGPFLRPLRWTIVLFVILGLLVGQLATQSDWQRWGLRLLIVAFGLYWFYVIQFYFPRYWMRTGIIGLNIIVTCAVIAVYNLLIAQIDMSLLYVLVIIFTAISWDRRAALFAAALASLLSIGVALSSPLPALTQIGFLLEPIVFFISAFLVSQMTEGLTLRWTTAAGEAEQQRNEIKRRNADLESLSEISQTFENMDDVTAAFRVLTERIAHLLQAEMCILARFEHKTSRLFGMAPGFGLTDEQIEHFQVQVDETLRGFWDPNQSDYMLVDDPRQLPPALAGLVQPFNMRQILTVRMTWRGNRIGLILLANRLDGQPFNVEQARLLAILSGQATVVVENARLYREAQTNLINITRLYAISAELAASSDPDEISRHVVQIIAQALNAPSAAIALLNKTTGQLEYAATLGLPEQVSQVPLRENGIGMSVAHSGTPRFIEDFQRAEEITPQIRAWGFRAAACLPIRHGRDTLGVLYVHYAERHAFTSSEENMLTIFADQVAIALQNARLLSAEQRRSMEAAALANLSHSLAESMDLEEMFRVVEQQVRANIPAADAGALLIYEPQSETLTARASFGYDPEVVRMMALHPGESIVGKTFQTNQPILLSGADAVKQARRTLRSDNLALLTAATPWSSTTQSVICAPMRASGETIGAAVLENIKSPEGFVQADLDLLISMTDRIALALRNAQLFAREQRRSKQLALVNELGHRVTSILDIDELALTLVRLIRDKFGYRYVHLFINDPSKQETLLRAGIGNTLSKLVPGVFTLKFGEGIVGWTAEQGKTIWANDVTKEPRFMYHPAVTETRAEIAVPLLVGTRIVGALDIQSEQTNAFDSTDVATLETLAGQVAVALDNARLYGEVQEQARHDSLTQVYNHGYFLERLNEEIGRAQLDAKPLSLIMLDVDHFKVYNDTYGHVTGDRVLSIIAQTIRAHVHASDLVGRWGGEEFCIALLETDSPGACYIAGRIRETLAETRIEQADGTVIPPPTVSQGIAIFPEHGRDGAALVDLADVALYRAKKLGRDQISVAAA
ncbi:MAG TPA: GAF domain-containing protein [Anaerolineae bacterium]